MSPLHAADGVRRPMSPWTSRRIFSAFRARVFAISSPRVVSAVSTSRGASFHGYCHHDRPSDHDVYITDMTDGLLEETVECIARINVAISIICTVLIVP